jgi:hypothetical protein
MREGGRFYFLSKLEQGIQDNDAGHWFFSGPRVVPQLDLR